MFFLREFLYGKLRADEIKRASKLIKGMKIDKFCETLTKNCWILGIEYQLILKDSEVLEIKLSGNKEQIIIRFHKTQMVFKDDYDRFLSTLDANDVNKGIYITTGVFEGNILINNKSMISTKKKVILEDGNKFIRGQLGLRGKAKDIIRYKNLNVHRYLPR